MDFYTVVKDEKRAYAAFRYDILWNVEMIAGQKKASGYIVQHLQRHMQPIAEHLPDQDYYEAWKVENGIVKGSEGFDDGFRVGLGRSREDELGQFCYSAGIIGQINYLGNVYWVSKEDPLYLIIDQWKEGTVRDAGDLKSSNSFPELQNRPVVCHHDYEHHWDLSNEEDIYQLGVPLLSKTFLRTDTCRERNMRLYVADMNTDDSIKERIIACAMNI